MRFLILLAMVVLAAARPEEDQYDPKYDNFNVDEIIDNIRLLKAYSLCFLGEGNCTPDGKNFKKWMPEAVQTDCAKCSEKQKAIVAKVMKATSEKLPEDWDKLVKLYDPEHKRTEELNAFIKKYVP